jgi:hypothetical protein
MTPSRVAFVQCGALDDYLPEGEQLLQPVSQQGVAQASQHRRRWQRRFSQFRRPQPSEQPQAGASVTGTLTHFFTHTSFSTHTGTFLCTVTGTHSV